MPCYDPVTYGPHPDPVLHRKLSKLGTLTRLYDFLKTPEDIYSLTEHFPASELSYSTQAQRVNVLLDTLLRPNGDLELGPAKPNVRWVKDDRARADHLVLGVASHAGGQWSENPVATSSDIQTLRY